MTVERDITRALFRRVDAMARAGEVWPGGMPVWWQNNSFKIPTGTYLRASMLFNPPERIDIARGRYHSMDGILQVTVAIQENGGDPVREASLVIGYFPPDLILVENGVEVRIIRRPDLGPFLQGTPHWEQPVNIHWQAKITGN